MLAVSRVSVLLLIRQVVCRSPTQAEGAKTRTYLLNCNFG